MAISDPATLQKMKLFTVVSSERIEMQTKHWGIENEITVKFR